MGLRDAARTVARSQASGSNDVHEAAGAHGASGLVYTVVPVVTNAVVQIKAAFRNYSQTLAVIGNFITRTRGEVAKCIAEDRFPNAVVERTCICKFVGTAFGVDAVSALRKVMGSHAIFAKSRLGRDTFVCNATCAAEGDNTVMELKVRKSCGLCAGVSRRPLNFVCCQVIGDMVRGRTSILPAGLALRSLTNRHSRRALFTFLRRMAAVKWLGRAALQEGQLLRDIAWARAHLLIIDAWRKQSQQPQSFLDAYATVLMKFPTPTCH